MTPSIGTTSDEPSAEAPSDAPPLAQPGRSLGAATAALPGVAVTPATQALGAVPDLPPFERPAPGGRTQILDAIPSAPETPSPSADTESGPASPARVGPAGTEILGAIPERFETRRELTPANTAIPAVTEVNRTQARGAVDERGESPWSALASEPKPDFWKDSAAKADWTQALQDRSAVEAWEAALKDTEEVRAWDQPGKEHEMSPLPDVASPPAAASPERNDSEEVETGSVPTDNLLIASELRSSTDSWNPPLVKESGTAPLAPKSRSQEDENG